MKRKLFTAVCFLLAAAMLPSGASAAGAGKGPKKEVGIQLYSEIGRASCRERV